MNNIESKTPEAFNELVNEAKTANVMLMRAVLDCMPLDDQKRLAMSHAQGCSICLESSMRELDKWSIQVTLVDAAGSRHVIADVANICLAAH